MHQSIDGFGAFYENCLYIGGVIIKKYILKRFIQMLPILLGVSIIIFFLFALLPGDYIDSNPKITPQRAQELRALYGLDKSIPERYVMWVKDLFHGNLGYSLQYQEPVLTLINRFIWNSFIISITTLLFTWSIALIIGVFSALKHHSLFDKITTVLVFGSMSFPSFFIGLLMIKFFAVDLRLLPVGGMIDTGSNAVGFEYALQVMRHMVLPVAILTFLSIGSLTRYFRSGMLDVIKADYVRTARAKGLPEKMVIFKHALKNAMLPAITLLGFQLPNLFSGAMITETIFNWPGIGRVQYESLAARDYPVLMTFTMLLAFLTILGNFFADIAYVAADPRIRIK